MKKPVYIAVVIVASGIAMTAAFFIAKALIKPKPSFPINPPSPPALSPQGPSQPNQEVAAPAPTNVVGKSAYVKGTSANLRSSGEIKTNNVIGVVNGSGTIVGKIESIGVDSNNATWYFVKLAKPLDGLFNIKINHAWVAASVVNVN
jgi:hypothetical protein